MRDLTPVALNGWRGRRLALIAAIVATLIASPGCQNGDGTELDPKVEAFKRERVITFVPPGGTLEFSGQNEEVNDDFGRTSAMVMRVYAYDDAAGARRGRIAVADVAESDGWQVTGGRGPSRDAVFAAKTLPTGAATLAIDDYGEAGEFKLKVHIEDGECPVTLCDIRQSSP